MKKRFIATALIATMVLSMTACGGKDSDTESQGKETAQKRSGQYELDTDKLVTKLADYKKFDIQLTQDYAVTDEKINANLDAILAQASGNYKEVTDRDTIEKGDYVLVDYTGYLDGEAFDRGAAQNQYVYVSDDNGYIPGFTDGLVGAKVGTTVTSDVTFPDPYTNNPDLAGKETQFEFVIHGIYTMDKLTKDNLTDEIVEKNFKDAYGVSTVDELKDYAKNYTQQYMDYQKNSEVVTLVKKYMIDNSTVEVPEEYLELRLNEYIAQFEKKNVTSDYKDLDDYLTKTYNMSLDQAKEEWKSLMTDTIKTELIFEKVAHEEGLKVEDESLKKYIDSSVQNYGFSSEEDLYNSFGNGNTDEGKVYIERLYLINTAIDLVVKNANIKEQA